MFENTRSGRQARNFTTNVSKILDLKFPASRGRRERPLLAGKISNRLPNRYSSENCRWVPLLNVSFVIILNAAESTLVKFIQIVLSMMKKHLNYWLTLLVR